LNLIRACDAHANLLPFSGLFFLLVGGPVFAQKDSPQEIQRQRQAIVTAMLTTERQEKVFQQRWICINGWEPSRVTEARTMGFDSTPDAFDSCVAALQRSAKDRRFGDVYARLLSETGGNAQRVETLPKAIGASVLSGDGKVSIGNGKAIVVTASMAFDAGFAVAYTEGAATKQGMDAQKLKAIAEACLGNSKDAGTCFSVGYVYGAQAFNAR
jgi:hypothetical protein